MAACGRKYGYVMASNLIKTLTRSTTFVPNWRSLSGIVSSEIISSHTEKWMQDTSKKSPMELINEVPPIKVEGRIVAFEIDTIPALGHPIEFICVDLKEPAVCKYCGLRDVQDHDTIPALGHPIEFICVDLKEPAVCKYCGLRDVQDHGDHHH